MTTKTKTTWRAVRLGDVGKVVTGKTPSTKDPENFGGSYPFITIPDLKDQRYIVKTDRTVSEKGAKILRSIKLPPNSVVMSCLATVGETGITAQESFTNQQINAVIPNTKITDPEFLYYLFRKLKRQFQSYDGSVYTNISKSKFENIEVDMPEVDEQKRIAGVLAAFDEKTENNNRIIKTLEEMAQAIFKERFNIPASNLPEGWEILNVGAVANNHDSRRVPLSSMERAKRNGNIPYYGANGILDYIDEALFSGEYVLFAEDGTVKTEKSTPVVFLVNGDFWVNNHAHIVSGKKVSNYFLYLSLRNIPVDQYITGGVQPKITQQNLNSIPVLMPSDSALVEFESVAQPIKEKLQLIQKENQKLAAMRDLLLPRLMRGEIRV